MSTVIDLMRHGKVQGEPALYGRTNIGVSPQGLGMMENAALNMAPLDTVFSSPLKRCLDFARILSMVHGANLNTLDALAEMDFGDWDGVPFDQLDVWDELHQFWAAPGQNTPPNGESLTAFHHRISQAWQSIVKGCSGKQNLVICHGGVIRMILAHLLNVDYLQGSWYSSLMIDYASVTRIEIPDHPNAVPVVRFINYLPDHHKGKS